MNCSLTAPLRSARHTAVKNAIADALVKIHGAAAVAVETPLGPGLRTPDVTLTLGTRVRAIDVCVVNPAAERYCSGQEPPTAGHAAAMAERRKELAYADSLAARNLAPDALVPFAIETTGRVGARAQAFLDGLHTEVPEERAATVREVVAFTLHRLRIIILKGNNYTIAVHNPHLQTLQGPAGNAPQAIDASDASLGDN
jgi:hypothetical protein